jgi:YHS domain-containing protein
MITSHGALCRIVLTCILLLAPFSASFGQSSPQTARVAIKGYDPVAFFTDNRPVKGSPQLSYEFDGSRYQFATAKNRDMFASDPDRYAPRFDGYCTGSMARGVRAEADPEAWIVADGKLYLFGAMKFKQIAEKDPQWLATRVAEAGKNWQNHKH